MKRNPKLALVLPFLVAAAVLVWLPQLKSSVAKKNNAGIGALRDEFLETDISRLISQSQLQSRPLKSSYQSWGRNPFYLEVAPAVTLQTPADEPVSEVIAPGMLVLNGIFWSEDQPSALINDKLVGIGDNVENYVVVDITKDAAVIRSGSINAQLKIGGSQNDSIE